MTIESMITKTLNKEEAVALFQRECVLFSQDGVPEWRVLELFGQTAADFISRAVAIDGYMKSGTDWNGWGSCEPGRPLRHYYTLPGFLKIVAEHNYILTLAMHNASKGGTMSDAIWEARSKDLDKKDKR